MSTVSKIPRAKHGQIIKNPGFSNKSQPIIKIKAVKKVSVKKGGKKKLRKQKTRKHKKSRKTKRRTRKAGSHSMIGRMTKPMKRAMGYYKKEPQHNYENDINIDPSNYSNRKFQPPQPIISKDPMDEPSIN
tara:strand:- start:142 stop:534 length:393 start_codon:yes stop_codon:yes gene_type:complete